MNWLNHLERKLGRFAVPRFMVVISGIMLAVYFLNFMIPEIDVTGYLYLDLALVAQGQIWRLITFIFLPPASSPLWIMFNLYFYCLIGNALEAEWGVFRFNVFYLSGVLGTILAALITGTGYNTFLNLSLFLAFAAIFPDFKLSLFFVFPIKIKYLAALDALYYIAMFIMGGWGMRAAIAMSLINVIIFFGGPFLHNLKQQAGYWKTRRNFRKYMNR